MSIMPKLIEYQRQFAAAILGLAGADEKLTAHPAIEIHRRTVLSGLSNALALSYPTVRTLTGAGYFNQLVKEYAIQHPPDDAILYHYGARLPDFLADFPGAEHYPYFRDVARFDWAVDQAAHRAPDELTNLKTIPGCGRLRLPTSLTCERFDYAVDTIRDALEAAEDGDWQGLDVLPSPRWLILWRSPQGASVKPVSAVAWHTLNDLVAGCDGETAVQRAIERYDVTQLSTALRHEILGSSFVFLDRSPVGKHPS